MHPKVHWIDPSELFYLEDTSLCQRFNGEVTMPSLQNVNALKRSVAGNVKIPGNTRPSKTARFMKYENDYTEFR